MGVVRPTLTFGELHVTSLTNSVFKQNCYVVVDSSTGSTLMIDPGMEEPFLVEYLETQKLKLDRILLTHGHFDHVGSAETIGKRFEVVGQIHASEERLVRQASIYAYRFAKVGLRSPRGLTFLPAEATTVTWGAWEVQVIPTPGHTSGSVCYAIDGKFVFTGDTLFHSHVGPTNYPESDKAALRASISGLLAALPDECVILPGHGRPWTIGEAKTWWAGLEGPAPDYFIFGDKTA